MVSAEERQAILAEFAAIGGETLAILMANDSGMTDQEFRAYLFDVWPEMAAQYYDAAGELAASWYDEAAPNAPYVAVIAPPVKPERVASNIGWALSTPNPLPNLNGSFERLVFDGARATTMLNVQSEQGAKYARHASANACAFCKLLATRSDVYSSEAAATRVQGRGRDVSVNATKQKWQRKAKGVKARGTRNIGDKYHDNCHCTAIEVRPGGLPYEPPDYVYAWSDELATAKQLATSGTPADILKAWNSLGN